jgi:hypothetical protein
VITARLIRGKPFVPFGPAGSRLTLFQSTVMITNRTTPKNTTATERPATTL